jgi:hypothetical protein
MRLHRTEHTAPFGDAIEFHEDGLFHQIGQFLDDEGALQGILVLGQSQFALMIS